MNHPEINYEIFFILVFQNFFIFLEILSRGDPKPRDLVQPGGLGGGGVYP